MDPNATLQLFIDASNDGAHDEAAEHLHNLRHWLVRDGLLPLANRQQWLRLLRLAEVGSNVLNTPVSD